MFVTSLDIDKSHSLLTDYISNPSKSGLVLMITQVLINQSYSKIAIPETMTVLTVMIEELNPVLEPLGLKVRAIDNLTFANDVRDPITGRSSAAVVSLERISTDNFGFIVKVIEDNTRIDNSHRKAMEILQIFLHETIHDAGLIIPEGRTVSNHERDVIEMITQFSTLTLMGQAGIFGDAAEFNVQQILRRTQGYADLIVLSLALCAALPETEKLLLDYGTRQDYKGIIEILAHLLSNKETANLLISYLEEELSIDFQTYKELKDIADKGDLTLQLLIEKRREFLKKVGGIYGNFKIGFTAALQKFASEDLNLPQIEKMQIADFKDKYLGTQEQRDQLVQKFIVKLHSN